MDGDIEDIECSTQGEYGYESARIRIVGVAFQFNKQQNRPNSPINISEIDVEGGVIIPEQHKLWITTFGCAHNFADGEYMKVCFR